MPDNFWNNLPKPFFALAPMYDVTDFALREMFARHGRPDVLFTEFVSVDGLLSDKGREKLIRLHLGLSSRQHPVVAQVWGSDPEKFRAVAGIIRELGFDGLDINMGCPDKQVVKSGAGAALIQNYELAREIISAAKEGGRGLPVSVKTRTGFNEDSLAEWLPIILSARPAAVTIHARTKKQMSKVSADWSAVARAVVIAKDSGVKIIGNGDVRSLSDGEKLSEATGCDGIMIGRGALGGYWFFNRSESSEKISVSEKLSALVEHAEIFEKHFAGLKRFIVLRKYIAHIISGFDGARELRTELMAASNAVEMKSVAAGYLARNSKVVQ